MEFGAAMQAAFAGQLPPPPAPRKAAKRKRVFEHDSRRGDLLKEYMQLISEDAATLEPREKPEGKRKDEYVGLRHAPLYGEEPADAFRALSWNRRRLAANFAKTLLPES